MGSCSFLRPSSRGFCLDSANVEFTLVSEVPEAGKATSEFKEYQLGKMALGGAEMGVLYFECTSGEFAQGAGGTVLVRGEVRSRYGNSEAEDAAREDTLRVVYESSRVLSDLLDCKSGAGLPSAFTMPAEM